MKIAVFGLGYVGLSMACLLSQKNQVVGVDVLAERVEKINKHISPLKDEYIEKYLKDKELNLIATTNEEFALNDADFVIISTPTNYNENENYFDTSIVESVIKKVIKINSSAIIVIKSTIPIGFTQKMIDKYSFKNILFSPEFLRESKALYDCLYPSRIIVGTNISDVELTNKANIFAGLLKESAIKENIPIKVMGYNEAESVKLFSNAYLALRVAYFNELDTYAKMKNLDSKSIIEGVCLDERIGDFYNNPSFGYGGYCLPKDTKQLRANYKDIPEKLISAIIESNDERKRFIGEQIFAEAKKLKHRNKKEDITQEEKVVIGIYRLTMKSNSDNFRQSAIQDIIAMLRSLGADIIIYETTLKDNNFEGIPAIDDIKVFKSESDIIVANRIENEIADVQDKVYSRDIFKRD